MPAARLRVSGTAPRDSAARRRRRRRRTLGVLVLCALLVIGGGWLAWRFVDESEVLVQEQCTAVVGPQTHTLTPDRAAQAAMIALVSIDRGLPARAATIGIATAIQESGLRNLDHGDLAGPDSRGLFQQRPSQGWGSEEQVMDPVYAANRFYQELEALVPDFADVPVTVAAQRVQRSAYPDAYADHEPEARAFASALTGHSQAGLNCVLRTPQGSGDPAALVEALGEQLSSVEITRGSGGDALQVQASGELGWAVVQWAVAHAQQFGVTSAAYGGLRWERAEHGWVPDTGVDRAPQGTVHITLQG